VKCQDYWLTGASEGMPDGGLARVVGVVLGGCWGGFALGVWGVYCFLSRRVRNGKPEGVYGSVGGQK
jgi:hypothetical protein